METQMNVLVINMDRRRLATNGRIAVCLIVCLACASCVRAQSPEASTNAPHSIATGTVNESARRTSSSGVSTTYVATRVLAIESQSTVARSFTGTLVARRASELGFKRIGRIESLHADQGDRIDSGQVLATLDTALLESEVAILEAQREAARAKLAELVAGPRTQTIAAARSQLTELRSVRDQLRSTFDRRARLANSDAISVQDIDDARHQLAAAEAKIEAQQHAIAELEEGTRREQIDAQQAEIARLDASIKNVMVQIQESSLLAPYDAVVSRRFVDEGAIVQPGVTLFKIIELAPYEAWVGVPPEVGATLDTARAYSLTVHERVIPAKLRALLPELDPTTRTQTAIFELDPRKVSTVSSPSPLVGAVGEIVNLNLVQTIEQSGFWLPMSALTRGVKGLWSVYVVVEKEGDQGELVVQRNDVEIVQIDSNRVLINGTVKSGDRVVVSGVQKLSPGQEVSLMDAPLQHSTTTDDAGLDTGN